MVKRLITIIIIYIKKKLSYRYNRGETLNMENYFRKHFRDTGRSIQSLMNKYSLYDCM